MRPINQKHKIERRYEILTVAAKLFAEKNYHQVLMDEVAEKAGVAKGSLYNYFSNKEDLYISIIVFRLESLLKLLHERIDNNQTPLINLRRIIIHIYSFMAKYPHFFQIWYREKLNCQNNTHQRIQELYQEIKDLLSVALDRGISEGILYPQCSKFIVDICLGMIDAAVIRSANLSTEEQRRERILLFEFILDAMGTEKAKQLHQSGLDEPKTLEEPSFVTD